jgi:hypothetical protein
VIAAPLRVKALVAPTDPQASTDTIVQWIRLHVSGVMVSLNLLV